MTRSLRRTFSCHWLNGVAGNEWAKTRHTFGMYKLNCWILIVVRPYNNSAILRCQQFVGCLFLCSQALVTWGGIPENRLQLSLFCAVCGENTWVDFTWPLVGFWFPILPTYLLPADNRVGLNILFLLKLKMLSALEEALLKGELSEPRDSGNSLKKQPEREREACAKYRGINRLFICQHYNIYDRLFTQQRKIMIRSLLKWFYYGSYRHRPDFGKGCGVRRGNIRRSVKLRNRFQ